jgi:hypothetical protein
MTFHGGHDFSSQYPRARIKEEGHPLALYATPPIQDLGVGAVGPTSQFPETHIRGLEYRTASSFNTTTASSGAFGRVGCEMPQKRSSPGEANGTPAKVAKAEHPEEFSNAVKKKLQSSTRTGQACDRCKVSSICGQTRLRPPRAFAQELIFHPMYIGTKDQMRWASRRMLALSAE